MEINKYILCRWQTAITNRKERCCKLMTREELRGIVEGITDDQLKQILDIHSSDIGRVKNDREALLAELEAAKGNSQRMEEKVRLLEAGQCEAEEMKKKIEELQKVIDQNTRAEEEKTAEADMMSRFGAVSEGRVFVNEITQKGVFEKFKATALDEANSEKTDAEMYNSLTEGLENIYAPQQTQIPIITGSAMGFGGDLAEGDVREIMGLY